MSLEINLGRVDLDVKGLEGLIPFWSFGANRTVTIFMYLIFNVH